MLMESGMGCCCQKEDALFWKNRHIDAMKQLAQVRQENIELRECLGDTNERLKDLNEKLDKATADYQALLAEHEEKIRTSAKCYASLVAERNGLAEIVSNKDETIHDLLERNKNLRERLEQTNESLRRSIKKGSSLGERVSYLETIRQSQAKEITRLRDIVDASNGSCSAYTQQGMQSKIAKQANEIRRLTEENERLSSKNDELSSQNAAQKANVTCAMEMWNKYEKETEDLKKALDTSLSFAEIKRLTEENKQLHRALDIAAKDADANFERGKIKGMKEIWNELVNCYDGRALEENNKIFGYHTIGDMLMNLSPTWFMNKAREYHEQKEKEEARDIQIGDEVQCFDLFCPDDDPHSDIGIVVIVDSERHSFVVIGPNFEGCFDTTDIQFGTVKKTGKHYDTIPLDYFT